MDPTILLAMKFWATFLFWVFHFEAFCIFSETGHRPWWYGHLLRRPHTPPSKNSNWTNGSVTCGPSKYLNLLVFMCIKKHTLWCVSMGSCVLHCSTSLMRGIDWFVRCPTIDLVPLISTGPHFYYFCYLSYLLWLFIFSQTLWNLKKCPIWKLFGIIFSSIICFFIYFSNQ